jgi:ATP-dependent helicase HrpA
MSLEKRIQKIRSHLPHAMLRDRDRLSRRLSRTFRHEARKEAPERLANLLAALEQQARDSAEKRRYRLNHRPRVTFPETLPITSKRDQIVRLIKENQVGWSHAGRSSHFHFCGKS